MTGRLTEVFSAALTADSGRIELARAAASLALIEYPDLNVDDVLAEIEALAGEVRAEVGQPSELHSAIERLNQALFVERGFAGNVQEYDDPRNSFLNDVLRRRMGIPITLSLVYIEIGRRLGLVLDGVGFPAHFIVRAGDETSGYRYIDPFHGGRQLSRDSLAASLRQQGGDPERQLEGFLAAITPRQLLSRMLNNLEGVYGRRGDFAKMREVLDLQLALAPWSLDRVRDRGLISARLGDLHGAFDDLVAYVENEPDAPDTARIRTLLAEIRQRLG